MLLLLIAILSFCAATSVFSLVAGKLQNTKLARIDKVLRMIRSFAVLLTCIYVAFFLPKKSLDITWFIIRFVPALLLLLILDAFHKRKMSKTTDKLQQIRQEIAAARNHPLYAHFLIRGDHIHSRTPLEKDLDDILRFDDLVTSGADALIPQMRTEKGKNYWERYIKYYLQARNPKSQQEQDKELLASGGWKCTCGRTNPSYTFTCTCGINKRDAKIL